MSTPAQDLADLQKSMRAIIEAQSRLTTETHRSHKASQGVNDALELYEDNLRGNTKLTTQQLDLQKKAIEAEKRKLQLDQRVIRQQQIVSDLTSKIALAASKGQQVDAQILKDRVIQSDIAKALIHHQNVAITASSLAHTKYTNSLQGIPGAINKFNAHLGSAGNILQGGFSGLLGKLGLFGNILGAVISQGAKAIDMSGKVMVANKGVIEGPNVNTGIFDQVMEGALRGIKAEDMAKLSAESRQTINAMGGLHNSMGQLDNISKQYFGSTGDLVEAQRQAFLTAAQFAQTGIKPAEKALQQYTDDMIQQAKINGMSLEQSRAMYDSVANEADSLEILKAARVGERESILANQRALILNNQALGMTAEQASEAAKMLNKLVAQKPLDRLRQAAKVQAYGAAMGLGAEAKAYAAEMNKPKAQQDKAVMSAFLTAATNKQDTMAQQGILAEITSTALVDKLGLESLIGPESKFSTTLGNELAKPLEEINKQYSEFRNSGVATANQVKQIAENVATMATDGTATMTAVLGIAGHFTEQNKNTPTPKNNEPGYLEKIQTGISSLFKSNNNSLDKQGEDKKNQSGISAIIDSSKKSIEQLSGNAINQTGISYAKPSNIPMTGIVGSTKTEQTSDAIKENQTKDATIQLADTNSKMLELTQKNANTTTNQLSKLDESSKYLKTIADTTPILVDLAEKQLAALTMSEQQRSQYASKLRSTNSKFAAEYTSID